MTVQNPTPPDGWGQDKLSEYFARTRNNVFATFQCNRPEYQRLSAIHDVFALVMADMVNPACGWFEVLHFLRAHSAYLAAVQVAMSTQLPECYMLVRGCIENALYGFYFFHKPDSQERWLRRHESSTSKKIVRNEFQHVLLLKLLNERDQRLGNIASTLYDRCIDYGAHPNERALTQMLAVDKTPGNVRFDLRYLTADTTAIALALKTCAQAGVFALRMFRHVLKERFDLLGATERLSKLERGL